MYSCVPENSRFVLALIGSKSGHLNYTNDADRAIMPHDQILRFARLTPEPAPGC